MSAAKPKRSGIGSLIRQNSELTLGIAEQLDDTHKSEGVQRTIDIAAIELNKNNPRMQIISKQRMFELTEPYKNSQSITFHSKEEESFFFGITLLAETIEANGLIHQILVEEQNGKYFIISGYRRYLAHILLGRKSVRCTVRQASTDLKRDITAFIENMSREDLSFAEQISAVDSIIARYQIAENKTLSVRNLAGLIGTSITHAHRIKTIVEGDRELFNKVVTGEIDSYRLYALALKAKEEAAALPSPEETSDSVQHKRKYKVNGQLSQTGLQKLFKLTNINIQIDWNSPNEIKKAWQLLIEEVESNE